MRVRNSDPTIHVVTCVAYNVQVLGVGRPGRVRNRRTLAPPQYMVDLYRSLTDENADSRRQRLAAAGVTTDDVVMSFTSKGTTLGYNVTLFITILLHKIGTVLSSYDR